MTDKYQQQAAQLARLLARGKTLRQASAIVARRWRKHERGTSRRGISPRPIRVQGEARRAA